ncbi:MAG: PfkB family carbohydrate kinase [Holophagales bacterium]|jgi:sugar/nucleoside kinase (ribokinase family)|nr:PfkB family carbohydrate kinase [Holophagales bacterium]
MTLLAVGSIAFDDLETPMGIRSHLLGGSATYFSISASNFYSIRLVAVVGDDFGSAEEAVYREHSINLDGVIRQPGSCFHWKGRYGLNMNEAHTIQTDLNVFANFVPNLPDNYKNTPYLFLGNIDPCLQLEVINQMSARPKWIALDTMNFWIDGSRDALEKVIKKIDILLINEAEAKSLSKESNVMKAAKIINSMGPKTVVIKRGEYGAMLVTPDICFPVPAMPIENIIDPTGAGDTFAGGFLGYLASQGNLEETSLKYAMFVGTIAASFTIENFGIEKIASVSMSDFQGRLKHFLEILRMPEL